MLLVTNQPINQPTNQPARAVPWLSLLVASISPRRPGFNPGSVRVGFVVDKAALGQVFPRVLRFSLVSFILPGSITRKNGKKLTIFITGLHNKSQGCGASVASAAGPSPLKKKKRKKIKIKKKYH
jgi:hypothetical protein